MQFWILLDVLIERFQIAESLRLGNGQHLAFNLSDASQAKFMNSLRWEIGCSLMADREAVPRLAVGQGPYAGIEPAVGRIILTHELGEPGIRRGDFTLHGAFNLFSQPLSISFRNGIVKLFQRFTKWTLVQRIVGNPLGLT